ncbi:hypothetical protein FNF29_06288 [Cafeteria roenbergensis]|uniref:Prenyltransferase alpha-alpha toroid domain-containing protein n=1 Tax=Cafeteria roenbergensis TaxID=33653 RepID=A0A5A8C8L8_CAFRO|nr:hypothetical protein FNF29_06288 [Cafeteria roenbergensis]|eukprot:KAA0148997.1 hypothetical protein FNF29_06288 [Cafeteria roenbergensis]
MADAASKERPIPAALAHLVADDEGVSSRTSREQERCENSCGIMLMPPERYAAAIRDVLFDSKDRAMLAREQHAEYLLESLGTMPSSYAGYDASLPWVAYWTTHSLDLLQALPDDSDIRHKVGRLVTETVQAASGGLCGGPGQEAHLAATYAGSLALMASGSRAGFLSLNRPRLYKWMYGLKAPRTGSLVVHQPDGEADARAVYSVVIAATLHGLLTPELVRGFSWFLQACQTHEGGFSGEPHGEGHGAYTYCSAAGLTLLRGWGSLHGGGGVRLLRLFRWLSRRQMQMEGGFQGRTHKLVDGCYSWWHGGTCRVIQVAARQLLGMPPLRPAAFEGAARALPDEVVQSALQPPPLDTSAGAAQPPPLSALPAIYETSRRLVASRERTAGAAAAGEHPLAAQSPPALSALDLAQLKAIAEGRLSALNSVALQQYVLRCCQQQEGGLRDKPGVRADLYHSCYCLSGLSAAQHDAAGARLRDCSAVSSAASSDAACRSPAEPLPEGGDEVPGVFGSPSNGLPPVDVLCNVRLDRSEQCLVWRATLPRASHDALLAAATHDAASVAHDAWAARVAST